jgi:hypothetical protein
MTNKSPKAQEVFDKVATHLLRQKEKSVALFNQFSYPLCAYRGENGTMCAVGCLIPNEKYHTGMEGWNVDFVTKDLPELAQHIYLLQNLQSIHDNEDVEQWEDKLRCLGEENNLDVSVLEKFT